MLSTLASNTSQVFINITPREGSVAYPSVLGSFIGNTTGVYIGAPEFNWWNFTATTPVSRGFKSFTVKIIDDNGDVTEYDNGGDGFPLPSDVIPLSGLSCATTAPAYKVDIVAAVSFTIPFLLKLTS
jgi:hypothetical protein